MHLIAVVQEKTSVAYVPQKCGFLGSWSNNVRTGRPQSVARVAQVRLLRHVVAVSYGLMQLEKAGFQFKYRKPAK